jgi:hypothetical protein
MRRIGEIDSHGFMEEDLYRMLDANFGEFPFHALG